MAVSKMKKIAFGISAVMLMAGSSAIQAASLKVGVAANFEAPLVDIIAAYNTAYPGHTITYTSASTGTLKSAIIAGGSYNGPYDLFLAANTAAPADLVSSYPSLVEGSAFTYATGYLTLWSNGLVDVSAGLPSNFYSLYGQVAIADHVAAPYGAAAWTILQGAPYYIASLPNSQVAEYSNIDTTFQTVSAQTKQIGFVAKSQVCHKSGGVETYTPSDPKYHHVYTASPIVQNGVKVERTIRSGADDSLLASFVTFLGGSTAAAIIQSYCYS